MDIKNTDNKCDLKCSFNFNYGETTVQTLLMNSRLLIKCGTPSVKPVKFNDFEYTPAGASITYPSETKYNGITADAEMSIVHTADLQKPLIVKIPISAGSITKPQLLEEIITQTANLLPKTSYTNLNIPSFSFESFVPKGPFYFSETNSSYTIYYGLDNSLFLSDETMTKLKQIVISPETYNETDVGELFYNSDGSNLTTNGSLGADFNFLECEQYYEEEMPIDVDNNPSLFEKLVSNPTIVSYIRVITFSIIAIIFAWYLYNYITNFVNPPNQTGAA